MITPTEGKVSKLEVKIFSVKSFES